MTAFLIALVAGSLAVAIFTGFEIPSLSEVTERGRVGGALAGRSFATPAGPHSRANT